MGDFQPTEKHWDSLMHSKQ